MVTYETTKAKGLNNIEKCINVLKFSEDHAANKLMLQMILESTQEMLRLEDLQICTKQNDVRGMLEAMRKEWI